MPDVVVVGAGPAGLMAAMAAARAGASVLVIEAGGAPGRKLLASGGGRCNLTNTLPAGEFMARFGRDGRFMQPALDLLGRDALCALLADLGVPTHAPDGRRIFPVDHSARTVLTALLAELDRLGVEVRTSTPATDLVVADGRAVGVHLPHDEVRAGSVILACGGCGYPALGGSDAGCRLAAAHGHRTLPAFPGMVALRTREGWPARCTADTVARARLRLRRRGKRPIEGNGDLIFTREGLAGPVVLDLSREITPLLANEGEQVLELVLTGRDQEAWRDDLIRARDELPQRSVAAWLQTEGKVAPSVSRVMCDLAGVPTDGTLQGLGRALLARLAAVLAQVEVTLVGHAGWDHAMVMRGGVSLRDVRPATLESRRLQGLFLAGEMLDLDGPCGGFNLQWAFGVGLPGGGVSAAGR